MLIYHSFLIADRDTTHLNHESLLKDSTKRYSLAKPVQILPLGLSFTETEPPALVTKGILAVTNPNTNTESKSPILVTKGILAVNRNTNTNTETRSPAFVTKSILAVTPSDAEVASIESGTWAWQASWLDVLGPDQ